MPININAPDPSVLKAAEQGRRAMETLGIPRFADMWKEIKGGGWGGTTDREWGNAGAAGQGAAFLKGQTEKAYGALQEARRGFADPRSSASFKNLMGLAAERTGRAEAAAAQEARTSAERMGGAGMGYDPQAVASERFKALAEAGFTAADQARQQELAAAQIAAQEYGTAVGGYTDLTKSFAELPTKYMSAWGNLLSGLNPGAFFGSVLEGVLADRAESIRRDAENERLMKQPREPNRPGYVRPAPELAPSGPSPFGLDLSLGRFGR